MDYININNLKRYENFNKFKDENIKKRIILMTTKSKSSYTNFIFKRDDILLFGRESKGVPLSIHNEIIDKLKIPISKKKLFFKCCDERGNSIFRSFKTK